MTVSDDEDDDEDSDDDDDDDDDAEPARFLRLMLRCRSCLRVGRFILCQSLSHYRQILLRLY